MKTIREEPFGNVRLRILEKGDAYVGIVISKGKVSAPIEGEDPDELWAQLRREAGTHAAGYVGYDGAKARFLEHYPAGFSDPEYFESKTRGERNYKLAAAEKLRTTLPLEAAIDAQDAGEAALAVFRATNLVSPFEQTRLQAALRGPNADDFVRGAAAFTMGDIKTGLDRMARALKPDDVAKWPAVTYLPYLWRPDEHMFLKPEVTKEFATRVGHPFAHEYTSELTAETYLSLLDLAREIGEKIADLEPSDNIDIQSFIWVVGKYTYTDTNKFVWEAGDLDFSAGDDPDEDESSEGPEPTQD